MADATPSRSGVETCEQEDALQLLGCHFDPARAGRILRDRLAACIGSSADEIASEILRSARDFADGIRDDVAIIVLRVPDDLGDDPSERVAMATGVPVDELQLPGYPHGQPKPPEPPS